MPSVRIHVDGGLAVASSFNAALFKLRDFRDGEAL